MLLVRQCGPFQICVRGVGTPGKRPISRPYDSLSTSKNALKSLSHWRFSLILAQVFAINTTSEAGQRLQPELATLGVTSNVLSVRGDTRLFVLTPVAGGA